MEKIHVGIYGGKGLFGGREEPLNVDEIYCDKYSDCSFYKEGCCLRIRSMNATCPHGKTIKSIGYTSRAKKYYEFKDKYEKDEVRGKLIYPKKSIGAVGEEVFLQYPHMTFDEKLRLINPYRTFQSLYVIPLEKFTPEFIYDICKFKPQAMMGGTITGYQKEVVPKFLSNLNDILPEFYKKFISMYPEYDKDIDYKGRIAQLNTLNPCTLNFKDNSQGRLNSTYEWDGEYIAYKKGFIDSHCFLKEYEVVEFKLKPTNKTTYKVTDNSQVNEKTIFLD